LLPKIFFKQAIISQHRKEGDFGFSVVSSASFTAIHEKPKEEIVKKGFLAI